MLDARFSLDGEVLNLPVYGRAMAKAERELDSSLQVPTKAENRQKSGRVSRRQAEIWRSHPKKSECNTYNF